MKIHISSKFDQKDHTFHDSFDLDATETQILENKEKITNLAIQKFSKKCKEYFKIEFGTMVFFEVYYFNKEAKEIEIFKKEKTA